MSYEELVAVKVLQLGYPYGSQTLTAESRAIVLRQPGRAVSAYSILQLDPGIGSHGFDSESAHWNTSIRGSGRECSLL
jgi:hypothetical protein